MAFKFFDDVSVRNTPAVSTAGTSIIDLGSGGQAKAYHAIHLQFNSAGTARTQAQIESEVSEIRVLINNNVQWKVKPRHLFDIQGLYGKTAIAGSLPLYFAYPWNRDKDSEDIMSIGMANVRDFRIEIQWSGTQAAPQLTAVEEYEKTFKELKAMMMINYQSIPVAASGINSLLDLPIKGSYAGLHLFEDAGSSNFTINDVEISLDGLVVRDVTDQQNTAIISRYNYAPVATDVFHIPFAGDGRFVQSSLRMLRANKTRVGQFKVDANLTVSSADTLEAVYEMWGVPEL